jgi:transcriptional regulator with XRE-family HTH domain
MLPKETATTHYVWAARFKTARLASGLSQKELGIRVGLDEFVASTRINRYELGVHRADYPMSVRLAAALNVPTAYLYCEVDEVAVVLLAFHRATKSARRAAIKVLTSAV